MTLWVAPIPPDTLQTHPLSDYSPLRWKEDPDSLVRQRLQYPSGTLHYKWACNKVREGGSWERRQMYPVASPLGPFLQFPWSWKTRSLCFLGYNKRQWVWCALKSNERLGQEWLKQFPLTTRDGCSKESSLRHSLVHVTQAAMACEPLRVCHTL